MIGHRVPDRDGAAVSTPITISVDGEPIEARVGQSLAAALIAAGTVAWRTTPRARRPRGAFCAMGVCFDCLVVVNGRHDVRACQHRVAAGDVVESSPWPDGRVSDGGDRG